MKTKLKKFEVIVTHTQTSRGSIIIEAKSLEDAEEMAEGLNADEITNLNPIDGELYIEGVKHIKFG